MIVILDTNVLLSAALRDKLPERVVIFVASAPDCRWLATPQILDEYVEVLRRPKFGFDEEILAQWLSLLERCTLLECEPPSLPDMLRDPKDVPFLAAAVSGAADYLITGDRDLLDVRESLPIQVVTVAEFAVIAGIM